MKVKALIFDMDGVIMDSMWMWKDLAVNYLKSLGKDPDPYINRRLQTMGMKQASEVLQKEYHVDKTPEEIANDITELITGYYVEEVQPKLHAAEAMAKLRDSGVRMCLATATDRPLVEAAMKRTGIFESFEFILTTTEVGHGKDKPDIFNRAAEKMGIDPGDMLVIEDSLLAIQTANAAGFNTCGVYDESQKPLFPKVSAAADVTVESLLEIIDLI